MNNTDERYMSYNPKDIVCNNARVCFDEGSRCWVAPGKSKLTKAQAEKLAVKMDKLMGKVK